MRKIRAIYLVFISVLFFSCSVDTTSYYTQSFDWMVNTFKENDAGYEFYLKEKGADNIDELIAQYHLRIDKVTSEEEFLSLSNDWLRHFRKGHIGFGKKPLEGGAVSQLESVQSRGNMVDLSKDEFISYLDEKGEDLESIEGIWSSSQYVIGIRSTNNNNNNYQAFIIEAYNPYWKPGQVKAILQKSNNDAFNVDFYMRNHSLKVLEASFIDEDKTILDMIGSWVKTYPVIDQSEKSMRYQKFITSHKPYLQRCSDNTLYVRIPSFMVSEKQSIDSVLAKYDKLIRSTPNLIIDIRNGTGGADGSSYGLIPYLYTNKIRHTGMRYRATETNAKQYESWNCKNIADMMRETDDKYIEMDGSRFMIKQNLKSKFPRKIAVICNQLNASADEGFLYLARQSYKVKIFGRPTAGAFDFSNINIVDSPDNKYQLYLTITQRKEFEDYRVDDIGIQPDFFIDMSVKEIDWVDYVLTEIEAS